jgi:hypothetical protein
MLPSAFLPEAPAPPLKSARLGDANRLVEIDVAERGGHFRSVELAFAELRGWRGIARMAEFQREIGEAMKRVVAIAALGLIAGAAAGCQTPEESSMQASNVCIASGLRPGTKAYQRCYAANFSNLRANSQSAQNAAIAGAALGVAGGAIAGAAIANSNQSYYYGPGWGPGWGAGPGWGPRCGWGGCW